MAKVQYLTIAQAERVQSSHLWVVNISSMSEAETFGDVLFNVPRLTGQGEPARVKVEMTWLPQDLNEQVPRDQILKSIEFRQAVSKQVIAIVSGDYAEQVLATDGARAERRRLADIRKSISKASGVARTIADSGAEVYNAQDLDRARHGKATIVDGRQALMGNTDHESYGVSEAFYSFAARLPSMSDGQAMNEIRARPTLKRRELKCILAHLSNDQDEARENITGRLARLDAKKMAKARGRD